MLADRLQELVELRVRRPEAVAEAAKRRRKPDALLGEHGRLMMIAADHPARADHLRHPRNGARCDLGGCGSEADELVDSFPQHASLRSPPHLA